MLEGKFAVLYSKNKVKYLNGSFNRLFGVGGATSDGSIYFDKKFLTNDFQKKFESSHKGTLLLDEISEMNIKLQSKLLRAIQENEIERIGCNTPIKIDLRIIATSNRNLNQEIQNGNFKC